MVDERRKSSRLFVSFPVECNILPEHYYFYTVSKDLSCGGVKILSSEFLPKNNHLKLNLNLIDRVLGIKARVAWCNKDRASERYNAGLEFIEMDESVKKHIDAFLK